MFHFLSSFDNGNCKLVHILGYFIGIVLKIGNFFSSFFKNYVIRPAIGLPVLPMPALQCTNIGGPQGWPVQPSPICSTAFDWWRRTSSRNSNIAAADRGVPKSGQLVNWKCATRLLSPVCVEVWRQKSRYYNKSCIHFFLIYLPSSFKGFGPLQRTNTCFMLSYIENAKCNLIILLFQEIKKKEKRKKVPSSRTPLRLRPGLKLDLV